MEKKTQELLKIKNDILKAALKLVPFNGWSEEVLVKASLKSGYDKAIWSLLFPNGVIEVVDLFCQQNDEEMVKAIRSWDITEKRYSKVRDRIAEAVKERLKIYSKNKTAIAKTISFLSLHFPRNIEILWRTLDHIWYEAGRDDSTDYNYYTKRLLLSGVYSTTLLFWLQDASESSVDTEEFLMRRIENIMQIAKIISPKN